MLTTVLVSLVLSKLVEGGLVEDAAIVGRDKSTDLKMRRYVDSVFEPLETRQSGTSTVNITQWNDSVLSSCSSALQSLNGVASNPSGIAACYNIPFCDNSTGVFHADLRLFMISQPTGSFAGISPADVKVDLSYASASVQTVDNAALRRRSYDLSGSLSAHELNKRQSQQPSLSQSYALYGQINQDSVGLDTSALQAAVMPTVTLSGTNAQGSTASTTLSMSEAAFLVGTFVQQKSVTQANVASAQAPIQTLVVQPGEQFVLPGTHILIAPIGGAITGAWAFLLAVTIGYGTFMRMKFKEQYRRRVSRAVGGRVGTI